MNAAIQAELRTVMEKWHRREAVPALLLGHGHGGRQSLVHDCAFRIIDACLQTGATDDFEAFHHYAVELARDFKLTPDEQGAAISLAWVALRRGWKKALAGFGEMQATSLTREAEA